MLNNFIIGFKAFINKKTPIVIALLLFTFFGFNYISNTLLEDLVIGINLKEYPLFLINYYQFDLLWFALATIGLFFLSNIATYLISNIITKSKKDIISDIPNCLVYTILIFLIFSFLGLIGYLSLLVMGYFSIIMLIIIAIIAIVVSLVTTFGILFLPVSKDIKESLSRSWVFIKKKFWLIVLMVLILGILNLAISYLFEIIYGQIKDSETTVIILFSIINVILSTYTIAVFSSFIKKKK